MKKKELLQFVNEHMMREDETLPRDPEWVKPFAVALVELEAGGFELRVAQPDVIAGRHHSNLPDVNIVDVFGRDKYSKAAKRFNLLVDEEL